MNLKSLKLKKAYSSDTENILEEFYIPTLQVSIEYWRLAGFFSSSSLAVAARGLQHLITNGGKMKLIACPRLTKADIEVIKSAQKDPDIYISQNFLRDLEQLEDGFERDHVRALGWMIANDKLHIRLCLPFDTYGNPQDHDSIDRSGIFHQKVGVLIDIEGNKVTFSGSVNETASGWLGNIEEFKVFRSWDNLELEYQEADITKFLRFWEGTSPKVHTFQIPEAIRKHLISIAPDVIEKEAIRYWNMALQSKKSTGIKLYDYQKLAIDSWVKNSNKGIFEMATGTGKTYCALGCIENVLKKMKQIGVVIATPYQHLSKQWLKEIERFGFVPGHLILADSTNPKWKHTLTDALIDLTLKNVDNLIIVTTHATFTSVDFDMIIKENKKGFYLMLVADEVHGLGARQARQYLGDKYDFRLGLSATPIRWFDTQGTEKLMEYFDGVIYEFPLGKAINTVNPATGRTFLTPYKYIPYFVNLSHDELSEYMDQTQKLVRMLGNSGKKQEENDLLERILFTRANIVKNADSKYHILNEIITQIKNEIKWTIIYCSHKQIDKAMEILNARGITCHRFTMEEGITPKKEFDFISEREFLLNKFQDGEYEVLVAMKCLDEGVDIPAARKAILMCSSGNTREYIQRIGRIIRRNKDKYFSIVYDIIVVPTTEALPEQLRKIELNIFSKELNRCREIASLAENSAESINKLDNYKNILIN